MTDSKLNRQTADMNEINQITEFYSQKLGHKIYVIEDAAQSFDADYEVKKSCNFSHIACTSFFPTKPLGCYGDGGALFTSDETLAITMKQIREHGQEKRYRYIRLGMNSRLDTLQAVILRVKLKHLNKELARKYNQLLSDKEVVLPKAAASRTHVFAQYTIRSKNRAELMQRFKTHHIPCTIHYPIPLNKQPVFYDASASCPISDKISEEVLSLPFALSLQDEQPQYIADIL